MPYDCGVSACPHALSDVMEGRAMVSQATLDAARLRISGSDQSAQRTIEHVHSNEDPAYEAFRTIRAHDQTLNRYYLQPHDAASGSEASSSFWRGSFVPISALHPFGPIQPEDRRS